MILIWYYKLNLKIFHELNRIIMILLMIKMTNKNKFYYYVINNNKKQKIYNNLKMLKIIYINK